MNKSEFMDLLRYYFRRIDEHDLADILSDYESHFAEGKERGLSEEEICKELGSPKDIYEMYLHEGMLNEKRGRQQFGMTKEKLTDAAGKLADGAGDLAISARRTWDKSISPKVPEAASTASSILLKILFSLCYAGGFIVFVVTALLLYILSGSFTLWGGVTPLPGLTTLTLLAFGGTGFFGGLTLIFAGREIQKRSHTNDTPPSSSHPVSEEKDTALPTADSKHPEVHPVTLAPAHGLARK